jgi:hypothetical protein
MIDVLYTRASPRSMGGIGRLTGLWHKNFVPFQFRVGTEPEVLERNSGTELKWREGFGSGPARNRSRLRTFVSLSGGTQ